MNKKNNLKSYIRDITRSDKIIALLMSVFVFLICAYHIPQRVTIYLAGDEFSQYSIAAYLAGYDCLFFTMVFKYDLFKRLIPELFFIFAADLIGQPI